MNSGLLSSRLFESTVCWRYANLEIGVPLGVAATVLPTRIQGAVGVEIDVEGVGRRGAAPLSRVDVRLAILII